MTDSSNSFQMYLTIDGCSYFCASSVQKHIPFIDINQPLSGWDRDSNPRIFRAVLHRFALLPAPPLRAGFPSLSIGAVQTPAGPFGA